MQASGLRMAWTCLNKVEIARTPPRDASHEHYWEWSQTTFRHSKRITTFPLFIYLLINRNEQNFEMEIVNIVKHVGIKMPACILAHCQAKSLYGEEKFEHLSPSLPTAGSYFDFWIQVSSQSFFSPIMNNKTWAR